MKVTKTETLRLRVDEGFKQRVEFFAGLQGISVADVMRIAALNYMSENVLRPNQTHKHGR